MTLNNLGESFMIYQEPFKVLCHFFIAVPLHSTPGWHDPIQIESYQLPLRMVVNL